MVTSSPQPHCQLRVHALADVNAAAGALGGGGKAGSEAKQRQQQHKSHSVVSSSRQTGPGSRHLGSRVSGASSSWSGWTGV